MSDTFSQLSDIIELVEVNDFLDDPNVEKSLLKLTSILARPEINPTNVAKHIVECEALAALFAIKAKYYMTIGKGEADSTAKKNFYMTLREQMHELGASLKYLVRAQV